MSDANEGVTHSLCTLEFIDHNEIYDWFVRNAPPILLEDSGAAGGGPRESYPRQTEYGRLNLEYAVTSKRKLAALVEAGAVDGWDDPRLPTLAGLRRKGVPPQALRLFCSRVGVTRVAGAIVEQAMLEGSVREVLELPPPTSDGASDDVTTGFSGPTPRAMAVLRPLPVTLTTLAEDQPLSLPVHVGHEELGRRSVPLTREIFIDRSDFLTADEAAEAGARTKGLTEDGQKAVRLRGCYVIRCESVERDPVTGEVVRLHCKFPGNPTVAYAPQ
jgi:glutaminyl-tRNA synthetase